jgi:uncharacterized protein (TIGR02246 family)
MDRIAAGALSSNSRQGVTIMCLRPVATALIVMAAFTPAHARSLDCASINQSSVAMFFDGWNAALATLDPKTVADRYAPDAVLLPTLSPVPRTDTAGIEDYFTGFLKKHPSGRIDSRTIRLGCNEAFDAGLYTFTVDGPNPGERVPVKARFTFIYEVRNGRWLITHHHSSRLPDGEKTASLDSAAGFNTAHFGSGPMASRSVADRCVLSLDEDASPSPSC